MTQIDKAGTAYWDDTWNKNDLPRPLVVQDITLDNYVNLQLHNFFKKILKDKKNFSILEIGCANSVWPIYFHQYFDAKVYGLDYSEVGCEKSRFLFKHYNVPGEIYCENLFSPSPELFGKFDFVVSFGVVEHFSNTAECLKSCSYFLKPGGKIITLIPNMPGMIGYIQKYIDPEIYDVHVPLTKQDLLLAHQIADLKVQYCDYFMAMNLCVVNSGKFSSKPYNKIFRHLLSGCSKIFWFLEKYGIRIPKNKITSPYIISLAIKG